MLPHMTAALSQATLRRIELASGELAADLPRRDGAPPAVVRAAARRPARGRAAGDPDGRRELRRVAGRARRVDPAHRGGVPHRPARPGPAAVAAPDRRPRAHRHRRLRAPAPAVGRRRGRAARARRGHPALRPGDRLRGRDGLRGCRRDPRRLGRPPGGAGGRRRRPRREPTTRWSPGPRRWAGTPRRRCASSSAAPRAGPGRARARCAARRAAQAVPCSSACRAAGRSCWSRSRGPRRGRRFFLRSGWPWGSGPARSWSARWRPTWRGAHASARDALYGLRAAPGWPAAPRPVAADDLLPERALAGDAVARDRLVAAIAPLSTARASCGTRWRSTWRAAARWRRARAPSSCTPTPCATGCAG